MDRAVIRRGAYGVSGLAFVVAAVLAAATDARAGIVAIGVGAASLVVAIWVDLGLHFAARREVAARARRDAAKRDAEVLAALKRLESANAAHRKATSASAARLDAAVEDLRRQLGDFRTKQFEKRVATIVKQLTSIGTQVDQGPSVALELSRLVDRVDVGPAALPIAGGWAVSPATLVALVDSVLDDGAIGTVVECGSGVSTVWTAAALHRRGAGHVYALEHEPHYARLTRDWLAAHDLQDWATVVDAPLGETELDGEQVRWFGLSALDALPDRIDLLLVDGPPGKTGPLARRPAFPLLADRLRAGSVVVLDDTDREPEQEIARSWTSGPVADRHLVLDAVVGRSTFFRVTTE